MSDEIDGSTEKDRGQAIEQKEGREWRFMIGDLLTFSDDGGIKIFGITIKKGGNKKDEDCKSSDPIGDSINRAIDQRNGGHAGDSGG